MSAPPPPPPPPPPRHPSREPGDFRERRIEAEPPWEVTVALLREAGLVMDSESGMALHPLVRTLSEGLLGNFNEPPVKAGTIASLIILGMSRLQTLEQEYLSGAGRAHAITAFEAQDWIDRVAGLAFRASLPIEQLHLAAPALKTLLLPPAQLAATWSAANTEVNEVAARTAYLGACFGAWESTLDSIDDLIELVKNGGTSGWNAGGIAFLGWACTHRVETASLATSVLSELELRGTGDRSQNLAYSLFVKGLYEESLGHAANARFALQRSLAEGATLEIPIESELRLAVARSSVALSDISLAAAEFADALEYAATWHDRRGMAYAKRGLAQVRALEGDREEARRLGEEFIAYLIEIGHQQVEEESATVRGWYADTPQANNAEMA